MNILGTSQISYAIILPTTAIVAFHLKVILVTYEIYWNDSSIRHDKKNLFHLKNNMTKIIYLSWNPYFKLLYMSWNFYRQILNVLLQNLMRMEHFETS